MIEKERLEELIKQGATIYRCYADVGVYGLRLKNVRVDTAHLWVNGRIGIPLNFLFETKEDAEFALKYQNITRTETLSLPTWEEFCDGKICEFNSNNKNVIIEKTLLIDFENLNQISSEMIYVGYVNENDTYDDLFRQPLTKENYYAACELCRKLFLGEDKLDKIEGETE